MARSPLSAALPRPKVVSVFLLALLIALLVSASSGVQAHHQRRPPGGGPAKDPRSAKDIEPGLYTGPYAHGGLWTESFAKASAVVAQMTLEEKVTFTTGHVGPCEGNLPGLARLDIPALCLQDGPTGLRFESFVSQFPAAVTVAASFDRSLMLARARALGKEFRQRGVHVLLGPVTGGPLGRSPLGGRNWEGPSPDPFLAAETSYLTVRGIQTRGVVTSLKHFIGYEQETFRTARWRIDGAVQTFRQISSEMDDKSMHETYLPSFAESIRAGAGSVMCSYNSLNGTHACENTRLLNTLLKGELNFQGFVVSDWDATWSNTSAALAGLDQTMPGQGMTPGGDFGQTLVELVRAGEVPEARIDDMVRRVLTPFYELGQDRGFPKSPSNKPRDVIVALDSAVQAVLTEPTSQSSAPTQGEKDDDDEDIPNVQANHFKLIRQIAAESTVLLKNVAQALPIRRRTRRLALFGSDAGPSALGLQACGDNDICSDAERDYYWPGTVTTAGGSGSAFAPYVITPLEAIAARGRASRRQVDFVLVDDAYLHINRTASLAEQCLVFVSAFAFEGFDREDLHLWNDGDRLIETVAAHCVNTVVVVHSPGPVLMERWIHHPNVTAVLLALLPGQESGHSIADVLFGDTNPSAKLPFTLGKRLADWPPHGVVSDLVDEPNARFTEGNLIDYRWFDAHQIEPTFPFGFGLSYTTFAYGQARVEREIRRDDRALQRTNEVFDGEGSLYDYVFTVTVDVTNTGPVVGSEVVQLYLSFPETEPDQPPVLLRGFDKLQRLEPGETRRARFRLRNKDLAVWSVDRQRWVRPDGTLCVRVGSDSRTFVGEPVELPSS